MALAPHCYDEVTERGLFSLALASADDLPADVDLGATHFVCLLAWDSRGVANEVVAEFAAHLLRIGAAYFMAWSFPDDYFLDSTRAGLAISIGNAEWSAVIANALQDPRQFIRHVSSRGVV